ncbi:UDP-N-acetylglucosamine 1-carboxyvinyltransferase [Candidatus Peregrinibacteria bacterium CG_4_10_14_0_2_um_filter_43_11]|nr:MAG: UDP-N-acetylglucosamine 1-carboxyvinyltransferase [Candidatus Peregrinibacteria bacterium CG_4_10_14_0_2_um_filter_43_11]
MNTDTFTIIGGHPLKGKVSVSGSKNAALPIIAAALLTNEEVILTNVPDIEDIKTVEHILKFIGVETTRKGGVLKIHAKNVKNIELNHDLVSKLRASILFVAPLLIRNKEARMAFPGGCVLGKRPVDAHLFALKAFGVKVLKDQDSLHLKSGALKGADFTMTEASVTATENAIMTAVLAKGETTIRLAACEPHVQDLCHFLNAMGAKIEGVGTHTITIRGVEKLHGTEHRIISDYLEAGTLVLAAAITKGDVEVCGIDPHHLDIFWQKLTEVGVKFELKKDSVHVFPSRALKATRLQTAVFPSFPTDLQAPFAILLTQAQGTSFIFETLFDGRLQYLYELARMQAAFKMLNPYQAEIDGPIQLKGANVNSCDIRAGAAIVLAALAAEGKSEVSNIYYIDRGYEGLDEKLKQLGAKIERNSEKEIPEKQQKKGNYSIKVIVKNEKSTFKNRPIKTQ